jgi:hypothetical protein
MSHRKMFLALHPNHRVASKWLAARSRTVAGDARLPQVPAQTTTSLNYWVRATPSAV